MHGNDRDKKWYVLPLVLYTAITYKSACWFLFPFFLASCFYALWVRSIYSCKRKDGVSHACRSCTHFLSLSIRSIFAWSFLAAFILIFPCLVVLLEFHSLVATCGAIFLLAYATIMVSMTLVVLVIIGRTFVKPVFKLLCWTSVFVAWWWFVDAYFFICVGISCGYVIANPILCCAVVPKSCVLVSYVGVYGLLVLYLLAAGGSVIWWVSGSRACGILTLVVLGIFGVEFASRELTERSTRISLSLKNIFSPGRLPADEFLADSELKGNNWTPEPWKSIAAFKCTGHETGVLEIVTELQRQFLVCSESAYWLQAARKDVGPVIDLIVGPESCLPCALNSEPSLYALFDNPGSCTSPRVLLGARRQEETHCTVSQSSSATQRLTLQEAFTRDFVTQKAVTMEASARDHNLLGKNKKCFNSAFIVHQGRIIYCYDKQFPLPFLETRSSPFWLSFLRGLFFSKQKVSRAKNMQAEKEKNSLFLSEGKTPYSAGTGTGEITLSLGGVVYYARLALCSDFFCNNTFYTQSFGTSWRALKTYMTNISLSELFAFEKSSLEKSSLEKNPLLIVLTHDSWFYGTSVADRMHRYAVLWAIRHQTPVLYVGNHRTSWIDCSGRVWPLVTVDS